MLEEIANLIHKEAVKKISSSQWAEKRRKVALDYALFSQQKLAEHKRRLAKDSKLAFDASPHWQQQLRRGLPTD
jgi:hypothetical protein